MDPGVKLRHKPPEALDHSRLVRPNQRQAGKYPEAYEETKGPNLYLAAIPLDPA